MKMNKLSALRVLFLLAFVLQILFPDISHSTTQSDFLSPCVNDLMGMDVINEYNDTLRKYLFTEKDVEEPGKLVRMVILPSFKTEKYLAIYKTKQGQYRLEFSEPENSIWSSLQERKIPAKYKDKNTPKVEDIKIKTYRKTISDKLANSVSNLWWEMIKKQQYSESTFMLLDGTMYLFSSGAGTCGMAVGIEGENVKSLINIGQKLKNYALQKETFAETETQITKDVKALLDKLTT